MTTRAKRKREKARRADRNLQLLASAQYSTAQTSEPYHLRFFDGQLVHEMVKDRRTFPVVYTCEWTTQTVFATKCGRVVAIGEPRYAHAKNPASCVACLARPGPPVSLVDRLRSALGQ